MQTMPSNTNATTKPIQNVSGSVFGQYVRKTSYFENISTIGTTLPNKTKKPRILKITINMKLRLLSLDVIANSKSSFAAWLS